MREWGPYRVGGRIGGRTSQVFAAVEVDTGDAVTLEVLPGGSAADAAAFAAASAALGRVHDPHLPPVQRVGEIDGAVFRTSPGGPAASLAALLTAHGPLPAERAVALVGAVAAALDAAHAAGLVHGDVAAANILVPSGDPGAAHLVGFGTADTGGYGTTEEATVRGVPDHPAPEWCEGRPVDARADTYALACVLFECLTGTRPFPGEGVPALLYAHVCTPPPRAGGRGPAVPPALEDVVVRGMAKRPEERFPAAGALAAAAREALTGPVPAFAGPVAAAGHDGGDPDRTEVVRERVTERIGGYRGAETVALGVAPGADPRTAAPPGPPTAVPPGPPAGPPAVHPAPPAGPPRGVGRVVAIVTAIALVAAAAAVGVTLVLTRSGTTGGAAPAGGGPAVATPPAAGPGAVPVARSIATPTVGATVPVGATPGYMEIAPDGSYGYIANRAAGVLSVFDTTRRVVTATIPVPEGGPQFVAFAPDGSRAYISIFNADYTVNLVGVLDTATNAFVATVPVGVRPFALDVTPDGSRVYVPNHDSGSITVIDTATNTVANTITVAPNPHWVDIADDGTRLYAANHESNVISIIEIPADRVLSTVAVGTSPHSLLRLPDSPLVLNVNYDDSTVSVTDTTTDEVIRTIPTGSHPQDITLAADGRHAYLATVDENAIQVLDTTTFEITATVPTGRSPTSVAVAPDGRQAYVTNLNDGTVTVLNIAGTA